MRIGSARERCGKKSPTRSERKRSRKNSGIPRVLRRARLSKCTDSSELSGFLVLYKADGLLGDE